MKAQELRIGNLVLQNGEPVDIFQLDRGGHTFWQINDMRIHKETGREQNTHELILQPIPLTEEWLVKFGFVFHWMSGMCLIELKINDSLRIIRPYNVSIMGELELDLRLDSVSTNSIKIKYVHQLQNLVHALTGEELNYG